MGRTLVGITAAGFAIIGLAGCAASPTASAPSQSADAPSTSQPTSSPVTVSDGSAAYKAVVTADMPALIDAYGSMPGCTAGDFVLCRTEVSTAKQVSQTLLTDLGTVSAPTAYQSFDSLIRQGMATAIDGCTEQIAGIDSFNAAQVQAGTDLITTATGLITQAVTVMPA